MKSWRKTTHALAESFGVASSPLDFFVIGVAAAPPTDDDDTAGECAAGDAELRDVDSLTPSKFPHLSNSKSNTY